LFGLISPAGWEAAAAEGGEGLGRGAAARIGRSERVERAVSASLVNQGAITSGNKSSGNFAGDGALRVASGSENLRACGARNVNNEYARACP